VFSETISIYDHEWVLESRLSMLQGGSLIWCLLGVSSYQQTQMRSVKDFELAGSCNCMTWFGNFDSPSNFL
jgi:hypothetical protein